MILGIVPARGGSKGIPGKNIREVAGKPLLQWTIEHARASRLLDAFVVSTENDEIGETSLRLGARLWRRPVELATDEASTLSVLHDVVTRFETKISTVVVLQPTSPIRSPGLIDECIECFRREGLDSLATGFVDKNAEYGRFQHYRRQDYKGRFCDDGNVYVIRADLVARGDRIGKRFGGLVISREENVEVDDMLDLTVVECILKDPFFPEMMDRARVKREGGFLSLSG